MSQGHILVQGAVVKCGFSVAPQTDVLIVKTHTHDYANDIKAADKLIATTKETGQTLKNNTFGKCKKQPLGNGDYKPCQAVITQWSGFHNKTTLSNNGKALTEQSKAGCPIGGPDCIEVVNHGQVNEISEQNIKNARTEVTEQLCPGIDFKRSDSKKTFFSITIKNKQTTSPKGVEKVTNHKNKTITVTVRIKTINTTNAFPITEKQINTAMQNFKSQAEKSFSGKTTKGYIVNFSINIDLEAPLTVHFLDIVQNLTINSNDFELQTMNYYAPGFVTENDFGNIRTGTIQISSKNTTFEGVATNQKPGAGGTISHELGHLLGLQHIEQEDYRKNYSILSTNLMKSPKNEKDRTLTPAQRDWIVDNIPEKN